MQASLIRRESGRRTYVVTRDDGRRWVAVHDVIRGGWHLENEHGRVVDDWGRLGFEIVAACERTFERVDA